MKVIIRDAFVSNDGLRIKLERDDGIVKEMSICPRWQRLIRNDFDKYITDEEAQELAKEIKGKVIDENNIKSFFENIRRRGKIIDEYFPSVNELLEAIVKGLYPCSNK